ncbi:latherin-like isoform X2 [Ovis aries]|uniref:latherin-like isoform X2 n=1 Tax=Ovis aries TaxID=9940 RepID=UPI001C2EF7CD|nr:latherin-like isoform X2 [Ovis aries]
MQESLLWRYWMDMVRSRASHQFSSSPSLSATSSPAIGSLTIYKVCPKAESTGNQLTETQDISAAHQRHPGAHSKMLKVSSLFILLCGMLALSSAQEVLSGVSSQINDVLTQELLSVGFLPSLQKVDLQESLQNVFSQPAGLLDINSDSNVVVELEDPRLLQVFLQDSINNKEAELLVALAFSVHTKTSRIPNFVWEYVEITIKNLIINNLGEKVCPFINSWLYNLNPQVANDLMNWLLQQNGYQAAVEIASK